MWASPVIDMFHAYNSPADYTDFATLRRSMICARRCLPRRGHHKLETLASSATAFSKSALLEAMWIEVSSANSRTGDVGALIQ
jgi:hypothetical protein